MSLSGVNKIPQNFKKVFFFKKLYKSQSVYLLPYPCMEKKCFENNFFCTLINLHPLRNLESNNSNSREGVQEFLSLYLG